MTYPQTQCLIFLRQQDRYGPWAGMNLQPASRVTRNGAVGVSTRTVRAVALLPVAFCNSHQSVVSHFDENGVHIVRHGDELRINDGDAVNFVECLLEENLDDEVDSLSMILTSNPNEYVSIILKSMFDSIRLKFRIEDPFCIDAFTRPAIDDQNAEFFQRLIRGCKYFFSETGEFPMKNLLSLAIRNGQDLLFKLSLDHGAGVNFVEDLYFGNTPLHFAVYANRNAIVELLLETGAHVDSRDERHQTPLHVAAENNQLNTAKVLLQQGADPDAGSNLGTPLHYGAKCTEDSSKLVQLLIDEGASVDNQTDECGKTPLHFWGNFEAARTLLENGADVNREDKNNRTPLLYQIEYRGKLDVIKILLDYGARIDFKYSYRGLSLNDSYVSDMNMKYVENVLEYLLNRCCVHVHGKDFKYDKERPRKLEHEWSRMVTCIFARHLVRVVSLNLQDRYSFDAADFWVEEEQGRSLPAFKDQCETEVSRMKSQLIAGTDLSVYALLAKDEHQVARLLRNQSVILDTNELKDMFPEYGLMLTCAVEKGRNRFAWQEQGIVSCNLLSPNFKRMPDELKEDIVSRLSIADIRSVKLACASLS